ncbi:hypothetical protein NHX12_009619 [Muraenolepis orangiensis]|uniref:Uncharacterized protein n=1 Tax=Muraenolepis orangiensis TaxID=630683 RepID=A0A9Q0DHJ1_9TELE|nr:hypothetical protein NHX12_009619 [Muraenolepis orangiensis]
MLAAPFDHLWQSQTYGEPQTAAGFRAKDARQTFSDEVDSYSYSDEDEDVGDGYSRTGKNLLCEVTL